MNSGHFFGNQPDFASVKPELQEAVEERGHILLFGPKCHPECMPIEMCWAHVKQYCGQHCGSPKKPPVCTVSATSLSEASHSFLRPLFEAYSKESNGLAVYEALEALKKLITIIEKEAKRISLYQCRLSNDNIIIHNTHLYMYAHTLTIICTRIYTFGFNILSSHMVIL